MNLHEFLAAADTAGYLVTIEREVDPYLEVARLAAENDGCPMPVQARQGQRVPGRGWRLLQPPLFRHGVGRARGSGDVPSGGGVGRAAADAGVGAAPTDIWRPVGP